ncbi:hypothetical protein EW026_g3461 [Hermanssonia centrifuga]|uniref:Cytochrome P450 n=1 Tax=Hermanssonia centrifuga TaxID=98765 RepID=A0A4S4KK34_9APHY|nr:hypothetical protein EW026_g3461 [Hermanssonia centrifuga]
MCRISKGWLAYLTVKDKKAHLYIKDLHERYGDIVRIGPNELSVIPKDTAATVIGPKGLPRGPYYNSRAHEGGVSLDGIRDPSLHAARRKPWARGMNSTAMKYYEDVIREETTTLLRVLRERKSEKTDISEWMSFLSFDVMGRMSFSSDLGMLKHGRDDHGLLNLIEHAVTDAAWISHIPWIIPLLKYLPSASKSWEDMKVVGATLVKRRVQDGSTHPDLFHYLMDEDGNEPVKPSLEVCAGDGMLAIIAGSDTAATTLSHVCNEALRLYPPVLGALQRRIEPETGGIVIGDHFIPAETQVSLYAYAIHRDPRHFWPIPDQFWPDRWLSQEKYVLPSGDVIPLDQMVNNREVFMPFSTGPMVCAGKNVAMAEMRAVISSIVQQFDMKVEDQCSLSKWEGDIHEVFVTSRGSLPVFLEPRFG